MRLLGLLALLTAQSALAGLTPAELDCVAKSTYFEARSKPPRDWEKTASVAVKRKQVYSKKQRFGAKSSNLCDIVTSKEYTTNIKLPIKEKEVYKEIKKVLSASSFPYNYLYFNHTKHTSTYR